MKSLMFISIFSVLLISQLTYGVPDGMASCAWGRHKRSYSTDGEHVLDSSSLLSLEKNVKFFLYKKEYPYPYQIYVNDTIRLQSGNFDTTKRTIFIIHGYRSSEKSSSCVLPRNALLKSGDYNIIIVDWNRAQYWGINHSIPSTYPAVVKKLKNIGEYVSQMINFLEKYGMNLNTTTIVGHSLGAHVAGIAGHHLVHKINRIIGLDPAAPYFTDKGPGERLSKEDARFVEVIHSDTDECGLIQQLGHYDFYPNRGRSQPGCETYKCSHSRSYRYFAESITTTVGFYARRCEDWQSMQNENCNGDIVLMGGLERTPINEGIYYVKTNDKSPFAMGRP